MLQHVLKDMYIDPELLAGLEEIEKETLFCCMREEQIRRWKLWDQKEVEAMQSEPFRTKRIGKKSVKWVLDDKGEPVVDVIDSPHVEESTEPTNEQPEQKELRLTIKDGHCVDLSPSKPAGEFSKYVNVDRVNKTNSLTSVVLNFNEKRGALQELSLNKVPKVARQVAEWEQRVTQDETMKKSLNNNNNNKIPMCAASRKIIEPASACEIQQEQLWREQQKKAKETEVRMRAIARIAREEHRRSLIENQNRNDNNQSFVITSSSSIDDIKNKIRKPPSNEAILNWYRCKELPKNAGLESNNKAADWFHGLLSRKEAEDSLSDEKEGTFLVRISERLGSYTISCKTSQGIKHYLIDASSTNGSYQLLMESEVKHLALGDLISFHKSNSLTANANEFLLQPCLKKRNLSTLFDK